MNTATLGQSTASFWWGVTLLLLISFIEYIGFILFCVISISTLSYFLGINEVPLI